MRIETYSEAGAFLDKAGAFLEQAEPINSLPLGMAHQLLRTPGNTTTPPFFATVQEGDVPQCAAVMTPPRPVLIYSPLADPHGACACLAAHLREQAWPVSGVLGPSGVATCFSELWQRQNDVSAEAKTRMLAYVLEEVIPPPPQDGQLRTATEEDTDQVIDWMLGFLTDINEPITREKAASRFSREIAAGDFFFWDNGRPVSMARRTRPTRNGICISGVYTPPELRGKGYATSCVARLSQELLDAGKRFCMLFADMANPTSNGIYRRIGYQPQMEFTSFVFSNPAE